MEPAGQKLIGTNASGQAGQGYSVSLSGDGNTVFVGGVADNGFTGAAWVFAQSALTVTKTHSGDFIQGQSGATYTINVSNSSDGEPTSGQVVVSDLARSADLFNLTLSGNGWICVQNGCSRFDVLQPGGSYPPITVTANVAALASSFTNVVNLSHGSSLATASDPTTVITPQLSMTVGHGSNFTQGQTNAHYLASITNIGTIPVSGIIVTDPLPTGLTLASIPSPSWTCSGTVCSLNSSLQPGSTIPLDVYVNVAANAPAIVNNQVTLTATGLAQPIVIADATGINPIATVVPASGAGSTQSFTFTFPSPNGYQDLAGAQIVINSMLTTVNSCYILFARPDIIYLASDSGIAFQATSPGTPAVLQNSQCVVLASLSSQSGAGNTLTLTLNVVFKAGFAGPKTVWANYNNNAGLAAGYQALGTYTATPPQSGFSSSVSPASGSRQAQAFTFSYFDPNGAPDISGAQIVFNSALSGANACYILFSANNNVSLASDDATTFNTAVLGKQTVLQNSQCSVYPGLSYQTQSGQNLNVTVFVAFKAGFAGAKNIYTSFNNNAGASSGFTILGTWTAPASAALSVNSVSPASAAGPSQALTFVYADPAGYADIVGSQVIVHPTPTAMNSCSIQFNRAAGSITLATDDGSGSTTATLGQIATLQNSQCIVNAAASSQYSAGNYLTLTLFVTMKTSGSQTVYASLAGATSATSLAQFGTWNVTSPATMTPVLVTPQTGAGVAGNTQLMTFTLSNPAGATDISGALIVLYPSLQGVGACYILWGHNNNLLSLASDDALTFTSGTTGTAGLLSNSQCTVDPQQSFSVQTVNTVNLTVAVAFKAAYRQFPQIYSWVNVQNAAHDLSGWSLLSRFSVQ